MGRSTPEELEKLLRRDRDACEQLVHANYRNVYALHYRLTRNAEDAADLTQETFRMAWEKIQSYRGESDISTWLYRLAYNTNIDFRRRNHRTQPARLNLESALRPEDVSVESPIGKRLMDADEHQKISRQVLRLDGGAQEIIVLHYFQQLTLKQTAEVLGVAVGTVKWRLNQALCELRKFLNIEDTR